MMRQTPHVVAACLSFTLLLSAGCRSSNTTSPTSGALGVVEASSSSELSGPPTMNATYGARNPRVCAKLTTVPNATQAAALVQCSTESDSSGSATPMLTLTTAIQIEVGSPRPEIAGTDDATDIDVSAKVYPIRGSGTLWQCLKDLPAGQNCISYPRDSTVSTGRCYKTTFGDYQCLLAVGGQNRVLNVAGPTTY